MVNQRLVKLAEKLGRKDLSRERTETRITETPQDLEGFTFVPNLGFHVADKVSMQDRNWYESKQELDEKGSFMLMPRMFWKYYDFVSDNRQDIMEGSLMDYNNDEWLDAIIQRNWNRIILRPDVILDKSTGKLTYDGGIRYPDAIPDGDEGFFNRSQIHSGTGMPKAIWGKGDFEYYQPQGEGPLVVPCRVFNRIDTGLYLRNSPLISSKHLGVRECKLRK